LLPLNAGSSEKYIPGRSLMVHVRPLAEISGSAAAVLGTTLYGRGAPGNCGSFETIKTIIRRGQGDYSLRPMRLFPVGSDRLRRYSTIPVI